MVRQIRRPVNRLTFMRIAAECFRSFRRKKDSLITSFHTSTPTVRSAVTLTALALLSFTFPFICLLVLKLYSEGIGIFWLLYLIFALLATVTSLIASHRSEWRHPFSNRRLLFTLYGSPIVLFLLIAGWAMKR